MECSVTDFIDNYIYVFEYNQSLMVCDRSAFDIMNYWWWPNAFLWFWSATGLSPLPQFLPQRIHKVEICSYLPSRSLRARSLRCLAQPLAQQADPLTSATRFIYVVYKDNIIYVNKYRLFYELCFLIYSVKTLLQIEKYGTSGVPGVHSTRSFRSLNAGHRS